jgi:hypothetical protein
MPHSSLHTPEPALEPFLQRLSPHLFWDVERQTLDAETHQQWLVERIVQRGFLADWHECLRHYGHDRVKQAVMQARFLDKKTLSYCSVYFNTPKEDFRCYQLSTQEPSLRQRWDY